MIIAVLTFLIIFFILEMRRLKSNAQRRERYLNKKNREQVNERRREDYAAANQAEINERRRERYKRSGKKKQVIITIVKFLGCSIKIKMDITSSTCSPSTKFF